MNEISSVSSVQPSFQSNRTVQKQENATAPQEIKDGGKKLALALTGLAAIAVGGIVLHKTGGFNKIANHFSGNGGNIAKGSDDLAGKGNELKNGVEKALQDKNPVAQAKAFEGITDSIRKESVDIAGNVTKVETEAGNLLADAKKAASSAKEYSLKEVNGAKHRIVKTDNGLSVMFKDIDGAPEIESIQQTLESGMRRYNFNNGKLTCMRDGLETLSDQGIKKAKTMYTFTQNGAQVMSNAEGKLAKSGSGLAETLTGFSTRHTLTDNALTKSELVYSAGKKGRKNIAELNFNNNAAERIDFKSFKKKENIAASNGEILGSFGFKDGKITKATNRKGDAYILKTGKDGVESFAKKK